MRMSTSNLYNRSAKRLGLTLSELRSKPLHEIEELGKINNKSNMGFKRLGYPISKLYKMLSPDQIKSRSKKTEKWCA